MFLWINCTIMARYLYCCNLLRTFLCRVLSRCVSSCDFLGACVSFMHFFFFYIQGSKNMGTNSSLHQINIELNLVYAKGDLASPSWVLLPL